MSIVLRGDRWELGDTVPQFRFINMNYVIIQTLDNHIQFGWSDNPETLIHDDLLRLHVFGEGGDLTIRRDEDMFYWRYVGSSESAPESDNDYGDNLEVSQEPMRALLWGRYQGNGHWQEDIVGKANLQYPADADTAEHTMIYAYAVTDTSNNQVVAYWTFRLGTPEYPTERA